MIATDHNALSLIAWLIVSLLTVIGVLISFILSYLVKNFNKRLDQIQSSFDTFIEEVVDIKDKIGGLEKSITKIDVHVENLTKRIDKMEDRNK